MTLADYLLVHFAITTFIMCWVLFVNRGVPWEPGAINVAVVFAGAIAGAVTIVFAALDWFGIV